MDCQLAGWLKMMVGLLIKEGDHAGLTHCHMGANSHHPAHVMSKPSLTAGMDDSQSDLTAWQLVAHGCVSD